MSEWTAALHHGFLNGIARLSPDEVRARIVPLSRDLHVAEQRLGGRPLHVHPSLLSTDTGQGNILAWGNRARSDARYAALVELVLRRTSGPWVTELSGGEYKGEIAPPVAGLETWLAETVRWLLGHRQAHQGRRGGVAELHPGAAAGPAAFGIPGSDVSIGYWRRLAELDDALARDCPKRSTLEVLEDAARQAGDQIVVLDSARRSAGSWTLDCAAHELHRAILGLPTYAVALLALKQSGQRLSREEAAAVYHHETTIPMSRERGNLGPNRRRERTFVAGPHGRQFFDMHAKPGNLTRLYVWVAGEHTPQGTSVQRIYIGHCGRHLS